MDPVIRTNTKAHVNLACPECGMSLMKAPQGGFVNYGETYCCRGCAAGTGCTCYAGTETRKSFRRPGDIGQRNAENTPKDKNFNAERDASGHEIGKRRHATAREYKSRDQRLWEPRSKRLRSQNKKRDSMREQARGRSERRGKLRLAGKIKTQKRVSGTGAKKK